MTKLQKNSFRKMRKSWGKAVNKAIADNNESKTIKDARKELLMGLFDDWVNKELKQEGR